MTQRHGCYISSATRFDIQGLKEALNRSKQTYSEHLKNKKDPHPFLGEGLFTTKLWFNP